MRKMYLLPMFLIGALVYGQVGVNNITPKSTLDVKSKTTDGSAAEGLIIPRVTGNSLKAADTAGVYGDDQDATMVFVTAPPDPASRTGQVEGMDSRGFYYFDAGTNRWVKVILSGTNTAAVTQLLCSSSTHIGTLEATSPAAGVSVTIPYNGGNGGIYSELIVPSIGVAGLNAVLPSGTLNNGSGTLTFNIIRIPAVAGTATFNIDLGGENCGFNLTVQPSSSFPDAVDVTVNGQTRQMMTRNLGADPTLDPNVMVQGIFGNYYQWGKKIAVATAYSTSSTISGWNTTNAPAGSWNGATEAAPVKVVANDPCPAGFRVPTRIEWQGFVSASTVSNVGTTWTANSSDFSTGKRFVNNGNTLVFPATGFRNYPSGVSVAHASNAYYWSSTESAGAAYSLWFGVSILEPANISGSNKRTYGYSVRCISE
jgi:uncharacterized protein (TIGR02145 family)